MTAPVDTERGFSLELELERDYLQRVNFDTEGLESIQVDEPPPLGSGDGPNPARLLGAALGGCLGASLLFCLRKSRIDVQGLHTSVDGTIARNERGRLRVQRMRIVLEPLVPAEQHERMGRCLEVFEDFCIVTASVRGGIDLEVVVEPRVPAAAGSL